MFLTPINSGITRWSTWPLLSWVVISRPRPWSNARPPLEMVNVSRGKKA